MLNNKKIESLMWKVFYFHFLVVFIQIIGNVSGVNLQENYVWFRVLFFALPALMLILHSLLILSPKRTLLFIILATVIGTFFEHIGLRDGIFFGAHYVYTLKPTIFTVPVIVIAYWAVFIYMGYATVNSFLYWHKHKKPSHKTGDYLLLFLTIIFDGFLVLAIDLFMDPIAIRGGSWQWLGGGPYFGVPIGNFIGWFIVAILVSGIFRTFEFYFPKKEQKYHKSLIIIPVVGYGSLALFLSYMAVRYQMYGLALLGSLLMLSIVTINILLYKGINKTITV